MKSTSSIKKTMMSLDLRVIQMMKTYWAGRLSPQLIGTTLKSETSKINLAVIFNIVNSIILGYMKLHSDSMMQNFPKKQVTMRGDFDEACFDSEDDEVPNMEGLDRDLLK